MPRSPSFGQLLQSERITTPIRMLRGHLVLEQMPKGRAKVLSILRDNWAKVEGSNRTSKGEGQWQGSNEVVFKEGGSFGK